MYLIKVKSLKLGDGWFRGFPDPESSKKFITTNIKFAKQYLNKNIAIKRKDEILHKTDAVEADIIKMDLLEFQDKLPQIEKSSLVFNEAIKIRLTGSNSGLSNFIAIIKEDFEIIDISDTIRDSNSKNSRIYLTIKKR